MTVPTARAAFGAPTFAARAPYVVVVPYSTRASSARTLPVEVRRPAQVELEIERVAPAGEVLVELELRAVDRARAAEDARAEAAREVVELPLGIGVEVDAAEAALRDADEQRPDRRVVEDVVGDIEVARRGRGGAEAGVEGCGDSGHASFSFRSRRTPAEAAWRAASSLEPRAAPISS